MTETEEENNIENCKLSQCDRTEVRTEEVQRKQTVQIPRAYYINLYKVSKYFL